MPRVEEAHRNPAIDRAMELIDEMVRSPGGLSLDELAARTSVTRSSAYRILNSLQAHGMVRALAGGSFVLGSRVLQLAASLSAAAMDHDLPRISQPHLDWAASETGETAKVSIHDRGAVLIVSGAPGQTAHALHTVTGRYQPLHAGAASKILLSYLPEQEFQRFMRTKLKVFTDKTLVDEGALRAERQKILEQKWSYDPGEYSPNINSYGAPIFAASGKMVAAVSIPFGAGRDEAHHQLVHRVTLECARMIGNELV